MSEHDHEQKTPDAGVPAVSIDELFGKPRRTTSFDVTVAGADGEPITRKMRYRAISGKAYDRLVADHPPTAQQQAEANGAAAFNLDTFAPALIAAVSLEPKLTYEQAERLWSSDDWSGGETSSLFFNAQRVCNSGIDVPFSGRG